MKLNLGCGFNREVGYVNVDKFTHCNPDIKVDLEVFPWRWKDNSIEEIRAYHVLEHLGQSTDVFLGVMKECYRVLKPGGTIHLRVPHPRSDNFLHDPTHVRPITPGAMALFSKKHNQDCIDRKWPSTPLGLYLDIDFELTKLFYHITKSWGDRHEKMAKVDVERAKAFINKAISEKFNVVEDIELTLTKV